MLLAANLQDVEMFDTDDPTISMSRDFNSSSTFLSAVDEKGSFAPFATTDEAVIEAEDKGAIYVLPCVKASPNTSFNKLSKSSVI